MKHHEHSRHDASAWTFSDGLIDRRDAFEREQNALRTLESADPAFARAITAKLVPDRVSNPDVIRSTLSRVDGRVMRDKR